MECTDYIFQNRHTGFHLIQRPAHPTAVRGEKDPPKPGLLGCVTTGLSCQDHLLHWKHSVQSQQLELRSGDGFGARWHFSNEECDEKTWQSSYESQLQ